MSNYRLYWIINQKKKDKENCIAENGACRHTYTEIKSYGHMTANEYWEGR